jgi:hypothetical protein
MKLMMMLKLMHEAGIERQATMNSAHWQPLP